MHNDLGNAKWRPESKKRHELILKLEMIACQYLRE